MRNIIKNFITKNKGIFISLVTGITFMSAYSESGELTLAKNGKALYSIVLPDSPTPVESTAAKELKKHLDEITDADFTIVNVAMLHVSQYDVTF